MDPGAPLVNDVHSPTQRQSILGSFLRVRPRGTSQSHQSPQNLQFDQSQESSTSVPTGNSAPISSASMPAQPPSPNPNNPGHRRRPAAGALQASVSNGFSASPASTGVGVHGFSNILRRRRSANGALAAANPSMTASPSPIDATPPALVSRPPATNSGTGLAHRIRLVPHLDSNRSLHFEPISRDVREGDMPLRIGRFTDRSGMGVAALNAQNTNKLAFKSKVVSRAHAEVWCESGGKFFIKDTKSSSGTFLNHIRLSGPNADSRPFPLKDGDVLQLGVDYQGGTEEIYKCVKMRIELGREWQSQANAFNTNALKQLKALSTQPSTGKPSSKLTVSKSGISDCCICLFSVTVHQSLFIAPCSHVFHYKCIRPMLHMHHPGFSCPLCRTFANLEEDVEIDLEDADISDNAEGTGTGGSGAEGPILPALAPGRNAMDVDAVLNVSAVLTAANEVAAQINGGAETEVERDFAPSNHRRRDVGATLRNNHSPSPIRNHFEGVPENADEYALAETDGEFGALFDDEHDEDMHVLPPLPVPSPSMQHLAAVPVPSASAPSPAAGASMSAPSQLQGFAIVRPLSDSNMNAGVIGTHGIVPDDASDGDMDNDGDGFEMLGDASGSSGEGVVGAGGKRKR
ncbi:hypothetical protein M0805_008699 [Coniferiporia weirii]|nr:hypothetical protein M0805_008699 [Coniferiporia weirii]